MLFAAVWVVVAAGVALAQAEKGSSDPLAAYRDPASLVAVPATVTRLRPRAGPHGAEGLPDTRSVRVALADAGTVPAGGVEGDAVLAGLEHEPHAWLRRLRTGETAVVVHPWGAGAQAVPAELPAVVPPPRGTHAFQAWAVLAGGAFPLAVAVLNSRARRRGSVGLGHGRGDAAVACLLVMVAPFLAMGAASYVAIARDAHASLAWPAVPGEVVVSRVVERGGNAFSRVVFEYEVGPRRYRADTPEWTLDVSGDRADAERFIAGYPRGPVTVRHDPADPSRAVIRPGPVPDQALPLGLLAGTGTVWLWGLWFVARRRRAAVARAATVADGPDPGP